MGLVQPLEAAALCQRCDPMQFALFWRWKSRPGRPRIPEELQALIRQRIAS
jgi:hypothetical protein